MITKEVLNGKLVAIREPLQKPSNYLIAKRSQLWLQIK